MALQLRAFEDVLNARFTAAAIVPPGQIAWANRTYVPTKGQPYCAVELAARARSPLGFGADGVQQWRGSLQVSVMFPRDTGTRDQAVMAQKVLDAFPRGLNLPLNGTGSPLIVEYSTAAPAVVFGDWSNLPVQISWFATE
jgi:hypothetical protein